MNITMPAVTLNMSGGINSELDINRVADMLGAAVERRSVAALRAAGIIVNAGSKRSGRS